MARWSELIPPKGVHELVYNPTIGYFFKNVFKSGVNPTNGAKLVFEEDYENVVSALQDLSESLHNTDVALEDHTWYALEIADWVLEGKTLKEAISEFLICNETPESWKK